MQLLCGCTDVYAGRFVKKMLDEPLLQACDPVTVARDGTHLLPKRTLMTLIQQFPPGTRAGGALNNAGRKQVKFGETLAGVLGGCEEVRMATLDGLDQARRRSLLEAPAGEALWKLLTWSGCAIQRPAKRQRRAKKTTDAITAEFMAQCFISTAAILLEKMQPATNGRISPRHFGTVLARCLANF